MQCVNSALLLLDFQCTFKFFQGLLDLSLKFADERLVGCRGSQFQLRQHEAFIVLQLPNLLAQFFYVGFRATWSFAPGDHRRVFEFRK